MPKLAEMPCDQLALALTGSELPMDEILAELRRRQALLNAAKAMVHCAEITIRTHGLAGSVFASSVKAYRAAQENQ